MALTRIAWKRNKRAGQRLGNRQVIKRLNKSDYDKHIRKRISNKPSYSEYKKKYGSKKYISLIKEGGKKIAYLDRLRRNKSDLLPKKSQKKWAQKVKSFKSKKAKKWLRTSD